MGTVASTVEVRVRVRVKVKVRVRVRVKVRVRVRVRLTSMRGSSGPGGEGRSDCSEPLGTSMRAASAETSVLQHSSASCCWKPPCSLCAANMG